MTSSWVLRGTTAWEEEPLTGGQKPASPRQTQMGTTRCLPQSYWGGGELA